MSPKRAGTQSFPLQTARLFSLNADCAHVCRIVVVVPAVSLQCKHGQVCQLVGLSAFAGYNHIPLDFSHLKFQTL